MRMPIRPVAIRLYALAVLASAALPLAAQRWQLQYFYDKSRSALAIGDIQFASAARGVAVGVIQEERRRRPVALVTSNGGARWDQVPLKEEPFSLFLLDERTGFMAAGGGLWRTVEAGRSWSKLPNPPAHIRRVFFFDEKHGIAACEKKTVLETRDGGRRWTKVEAAAEPPGDPRYSAYNWIAFSTPKTGVVTGWNLPPQRFGPALPDYVDPQATLEYRERPHLSISLETHDGGATWKPFSSSAFGMITRVRLGPGGTGLGLVEYTESFPVPSEVYSINARGTSASVYKDKRFAITDLWLAADGTAYLAGSLINGRLRLIPGKVRVLRSRDLKTWSEMDVDYRAIAKRVTLAEAGGEMWLATDSGMILKLARP